ncbi:MAG TPA: response regulator [Candidatus Tectomicrobia bacterium]|nr:response regulator [Candidatus Tectomicrobia bacterium]
MLPGRLHDRHILLIEDDQDTRDVLQLMLEACEAEVVAVATAEEGLDRIARARFDAVVSDLAMPRESGFWFIWRIRQLARHVPVVAVTGQPYPRDLAVQAGFDAYLRKPVDRDALCAAILEAIERCRR